MFHAITQPDKITLLEQVATFLDQFGFDVEKLLMTVAAKVAGLHAGWHAIDMNANAKRLVLIKLQKVVSISKPPA